MARRAPAGIGPSATEIAVNIRILCLWGEAANSLISWNIRLV